MAEQWRIVDRGGAQELPRTVPHALAAAASKLGGAVALQGVDLRGEEVTQVAPWPSHGL